MRTKKPRWTDKHMYPGYIGIDMSILNPGICYNVGDQPPVCRSWTTPSAKLYKHRIERFDHIADQLIEVISPALLHVNTFVLIEDYAFSQGGKTFEIAECCGILKWKLIYRTGLPSSRLLLCSTTHLKMFVCEKGNAKKELVLKDCLKRWSFDTDNNNEADAYVLWKLLRGICGVEKYNAYQTDIIGRVKEYNGR